LLEIKINKPHVTFINDLSTQIRYGAFMHILFLFGWALLIAAFAAAASEPFVTIASSGRDLSGSVITSAYDLWYTLAPGHLVLSKIRLESILPALWDPVLTSILVLPAWFLLGVPGTTLAWLCRPNKIMTAEVREEYERQKESLFLIDELNRLAKEDETYHPHEDDRAPVHELFDLDKSEDEDIRKAVSDQKNPSMYPTLDDMETFTEDQQLLDINQLYAELDQLESTQDEQPLPKITKEES
jgi:hypothetical protein